MSSTIAYGKPLFSHKDTRLDFPIKDLLTAAINHTQDGRSQRLAEESQEAKRFFAPHFSLGETDRQVLNHSPPPYVCVHQPHRRTGGIKVHPKHLTFLFFIVLLIGGCGGSSDDMAPNNPDNRENTFIPEQQVELIQETYLHSRVTLYSKKNTFKSVIISALGVGDQ
ncbi:hypothetical protein [Desulfoluna spongiiphila]|uniref:hypothetical protein n=1 Tax=Desulfoluna spongiiphila TaxID=419481 RepID=UPI001114206B|nr:hypothetical protein [Desulfoluna spongiiphila]